MYNDLMTACDMTDFDYQPAKIPENGSALETAWSVGIGLQQVDGLEPSEYLREVARETVEGGMTLAGAGQALRAYYKQRDAQGLHSDVREREADFVSHRIAEMLASRAFVFAPDMLPSVHQMLFQDLDAQVYQPGMFKTEQILVKPETILNGDSVMYGAPLLSNRVFHTCSKKRVNRITVPSLALKGSNAFLNLLRKCGRCIRSARAIRVLLPYLLRFILIIWGLMLRTSRSNGTHAISATRSCAPIIAMRKRASCRIAHIWCGSSKTC